MKNYKMTIAYDGSRYYGWQRLKNKETIQGKIEDVLEKMTGEKVEINGAGRTDAGVHANNMVANVFFETDMTSEGITEYLNKYLPEDIAVKEVREASERFHARYNAVGKTYCYKCYFGKVKPVFDRKYVYTLDKMPDIKHMRKAAEFMLGEKDFASFCGNPHMKKSTVRNVDRIDILHKDGYIIFKFHGDGFLQNMVRIMVGTLLEVGYGNMVPEDITAILESKKRSNAGPKVPAKGLCLEKVDY